MVLTYDAYSETLENQKVKEDKLSIMEKQYNTMQSQMQTMLSILSGLDQSGKNTMAKRLIEEQVYHQEPAS
jgi:polyphosphate kinase 2 (PPK2 family)